MAIEIIRPASRVDWLAGRGATVGASELPSLFGVHPYMTPFELFAVKSGAYVKEFAEAEIEADAIHLPPTERGNLFEDDAFELIQRLRPEWRIEPNQIPGGCVFVDRDARMSSTPDAFVVAPDRAGKGACQVKTLNDRAFRESWQVDGAIEPPVAVAVQAITDATLSGCEWACAAALVVGFKTSLYLIDVPLHAKLMAKARELVADFWRRVAENSPYAPDFARDGAVIAGLFGEDDGGEVNLSGDARIVEILAQRAKLKETEAMGSAAAKDRKTLDAEIIMKMGNAATGRLADGREITAKTVRRKGFTVEPTSYRAVRVKGEAA